MAQFLNDTFGSNDVALSSHTGETGATWTRIFDSGGTQSKVIGGFANFTGTQVWSASGTPAGADYEVTAVTVYKGNQAADFHLTGPAGRLAGSGDGYFAAWRTDQGRIELHKLVAGARTMIGSYTISTPAADTSVTLALRMVGSTISVKKDGTEVISVTDTTYSAAGKAGLHGRAAGISSAFGVNDGWPMTSLSADDIAGGSDTQAPNVPSPSVGTRTASQITWNWSAVTDNGGGSVSGYQIQLLDAADTVLATTDLGSVLTYTCPATTGNTTRKLKVLAYDNAVPRNNSAYSSAVSSTTLSKTATFTVKDANGTAQASETALRWAACSGTVGSALTVVAQGTAETTDGSGNCTVDLNSTSLSAGASITIILADDSPSARLGVLEGVTVSEA